MIDVENTRTGRMSGEALDVALAELSQHNFLADTDDSDSDSGSGQRDGNGGDA